MKLIIQIPCYNEEKVLPLVLKELPRKIKGIKKVDWLVIDDGSTDKTVSVAKKYKVDHIISHTHNKGLAKAFMTGINESLLKGADVIVNIDADNQYPIAGFQFTIGDIPDMLEAVSVATTDRSEGFLLEFNEQTDGSVIIVGFNITGGTIDIGTGSIMQLTYQAATANEEIIIVLDMIEFYLGDSTGIALPAFITSELKTAFQIGFLLFLPFLVIDMVVASVLMSLGMMMLSPMLVALPFKILLFVLVDGWSMTVGSLVSTFVSQ